MKKHINIVSFLLVLGITTMQAQVGLPTNTSNIDAVLDLNSTNGSATKGLLLPNVALSDLNTAAPLSNHVAGMHIYNTATSGSGTSAVTPGEYYNDGSRWIRIANTGWAIGGNTGTNAIGTSDANGFALGTNSTVRTQITPTGNVLVGTTTIPTGGNNAKLIVNNGTTKGAIQIKDGTQQNGAILVSDANGVARWQKTSLTTIYRNNVWQDFPPTGYNIMQTDQPMTITTKGTYMAILRWIGMGDSVNSNGVTSAYFALYKNGVIMDEIEYYYTTVYGFNTYTFNITMLAPNCAVGDVLTIGIKPSVGNPSGARSWHTFGAGYPTKMASIIVSKL